MKLPSVKTAEGFSYSTAPQRSPEWIALRVGKITASRLGDWFAVGKTGKPLVARTAYERELAFELAFNVPFTRFVSAAMEQGEQAEALLRAEIAKVRGYEVLTAGAFYNDHFVASPDGLVDEDGLVEFKWLYDTKFSEVLGSGVPREHFLQVQGQLWAADRDWCDYVAGNANTKAFKLIRIERDEETIKMIAEEVASELELPTIDLTDVYDIKSAVQAEEVSW